MLFSERLNQIRRNNSLSQATVAKAMQMSLRSYQRYEHGEREPGLSTLVALADFFAVSIDYLVGRTDNPQVNR